MNSLREKNYAIPDGMFGLLGLTYRCLSVLDEKFIIREVSREVIREVSS